MITIRSAMFNDLDGIMDVERETFGEVGDGAMASRELMADRIQLLNANSTWFWVAEHEGKIVGDMILQPTRMTPDECTSWAHATDDGTLKKTFDEAGKTIYGVSLAVSSRAPEGTSELLIHRLLQSWLDTGKDCFMICSRMPGFKEAHEQTAIAAEDYWQQRRLSDGKPVDWMLRLFQDMIGVSPQRLLINGFPVDEDSGGHGVLCVSTDPIPTMKALSAWLDSRGISCGLDFKDV